MSVKHTNFYENLEEASMRLHRTLVMYDGEPYYVYAIASHKDGVFRMYLEPMVDTGKGRVSPNYSLRVIADSYAPSDAAIGAALDKWLEENKTSTVIRKKINSPAFNRFRPFPLGMINTGKQGDGRCYYIERQPMRHREQGLTAAMMCETLVTCGQAFSSNQGLSSVTMYSETFRDMVVGKYPSARECLDALMDSEVTNEAIAFNRLFALVRGPLDVIYLGYKDEIVGRLTRDDLREVQLGTRFRHLKEAVEELKAFGSVRM